MDNLIKLLLDDDINQFLNKLILIIENQVASGIMSNESIAQIMSLTEQKDYFAIIDFLTTIVE